MDISVFILIHMHMYLLIIQYNINDNKTYKMDIIFDTMQLQKHLNLEKHIIIKTDFKFNKFTKTQTIIDCYHPG